MNGENLWKGVFMDSNVRMVIEETLILIFLILYIDRDWLIEFMAIIIEIDLHGAILNNYTIGTKKFCIVSPYI